MGGSFCAWRLQLELPERVKGRAGLSRVYQVQLKRLHDILHVLD